MTEYQFVQLVKEMRRLQADYKRTGNMKLWSMIGQKENLVDAAIIRYEIDQEKKQPVQQTLSDLFDDKPLNKE